MIFSAATFLGAIALFSQQVPAPNLITDLTKGEDLLVLASGLTFAQLSITQNGNAAFIRIGQNGQRLAAVNGVLGSAIDLNDFTIFG
jgi:hypothetical protein